jgi:hypothetical protein
VEHVLGSPQGRARRERAAEPPERAIELDELRLRKPSLIEALGPNAPVAVARDAEQHKGRRHRAGDLTRG